MLTSKPTRQMLVRLEQVERHLRQAQRLVIDGAPCAQVLQETMAARDGMGEVRHALQLHAMNTRLSQLEDCADEAVPALFDEILEIFERK